MAEPTTAATDEEQIRLVLQRWAMATRKGHRDDILANHLLDVLIYDVLAPMKYEGAAAYRQSWDEWQPETQGEGQFDLQDLSVVAGTDVAFAHCFIKCGGVLPNGRTFEDLVRATFCLRKASGSWKVAHQHISKPFQLAGA
jgi:ketosteroid isomerase-like protein